MYAQVIDDSAGRTLAAASTVDKELRGEAATTAATSRRPQAVGKAIAERALAAGIKQVAFDRGSLPVSWPRGRPGRRGPRGRFELLVVRAVGCNSRCDQRSDFSRSHERSDRISFTQIARCLAKKRGNCSGR